MSKYSEQIISVIEKLKAEIFERLDNGEEVYIEEIKDITRNAFKETAKEFNVTSSTIESKCTRDMNINTEEFYELVKDYLLGNESALENKVIDNCKENDSPADLKAALNKLKY